MGMDRKTDFCTMKNGQPYIFLNMGYMRLTNDKKVAVHRWAFLEPKVP